MKKIVKIFLSFLLIVLAVALIVPMALKGKIAQIVKTEANKMLTATLDFQELDISLLRHFPNASLELDGLTLVSGVEPFVGDTIVAADRISVVVNLLSLFGDSGFEVKRILLDEPHIHGAKSSSGAVNWDVMKPAEEPAEAEIADEAVDEEPSSFRLALRDVTISDAVLRYDDDSTRMYASITPLNLSLRGNLSASQSDLKLKTLARQICFESGGLKLANGLEMELDADIAADLEQQIFTLNKNRFRVNAIEMMLDGWAALKESGTEMDLKLCAEEVEFREVLSLVPAFYTRDFQDLKASGELNLTAWAKGLLAGDRLPAFELALGVEDGRFKYASLPQAVEQIRLSAQVTNPGGTLDATRAEISHFGMQMAGQSLSASLAVATPVSDLQFDAAVDGKIDLGAIEQVYPLEEGMALKGLVTADLKAAGRMSHIAKQRFDQMQASGTFTIEGLDATLQELPALYIERTTATVSPKALTLGECRVQLGESDLAANGQLTNYLDWLLNGGLLSGRLYLQSNLLDLNELMGARPASEESGEELPATEPAEAESTPAVFVVPQNLDLSLQSSVKKILFQKMTITDFVGNIAVHDGKAEMSKLSMKALGGELAATASYSTAEDPASPALSLSADIKEASFSRTFNELEMIQKIVPLFEQTGGTYAMKLQLTSRMGTGFSVDYPTLNASGEISSSNIQLGNVGVFNALSKAINAEKLQSSLAGELVVVKFAIHSGRLSTQPFDLKLGSTKLTLSGSTGLDQTIDYTARVALPGKAGNLLQNLDVKIGGTFSSPKISVNTASAAKEAVSNVVNEQIQKLTGSEDVNAEISKQAEKLRQEARSAGEKLVAEAQKQKEALVAKASGKLAKLAAEKAGDALVKEAEKQAEKLSTKAEEEISKLENKAAGK